MATQGIAAENHGVSATVGLPTDIVALILDILRETSPKTLVSVALTCRAYYTLARYSQYRTLVLPLKRPELVATRLQYIEEHDLISAVREVIARDACVPLDHANTDTLGRLLPQMSGLHDFTWPEPLLPFKIVRWDPWDLNANEDVRLHSHFSYSEFSTHPPFNGLPSMNLMSLRSLIGFRNLSSLVVSKRPVDAVSETH